MKIEYIDDAIAGSGYGFLVFSEAAFPPSPLSFAILRASDHQYATGKANSWTGEKVFIPVNAQPGADGILQAPIGPQIVNALNSQEIYGITLKGTGGQELGGRLKVGKITYSQEDALDNTDSARAEKLVKGTEKADKNTVPVKENGQGPETAAQQDEKAREKPEAGNSGPLNMPEPEKRKSAAYWRWIIIALLCFGCLAWYFIDPRETHKGEPTKQGAENAFVPEKPLRPDNSENAADPRINFQGQNLSPAEAAALSRELPRATNSEKDAIYRLYYFAASHGEPGILLDYAACIDPSLPMWGSIEKDAPLAFSIYEKAKKLEPEKAAKAEKHLLEWLEQNAPQNRRAKIWLDELVK